MMSISLAALDATVVATALPTIVGNLGGLNLFSWVFSIYLLTSTVGVPLCGKLADIYGRKPVLLAGCTVFLLGSFLCGLSQSMEQLIFFRAIQGLGAGAVMPVVMTVIGDLFPIEERARIQGLTSSVWGISGIAGPALGALLTESVGWRWVFYVNMPFGLAAILIFWYFFHEQVQKREHSLDFRGVALLSGAIVSLLLALLQSVDTYGWTGNETLILFGLALVLLSAFIWQERRAKEPLLPLQLFSNRIISIACLAGFTSGGLMFGISSYVPLFIQGVYGGSAIDAGLILGPVSVAWPVGSTIAGRLIPKVGYYPCAVLGAICLTIGPAILLLMDRDTTRLIPLTAVVFEGLGMGLSMSALIISVQNAVDWSQRGVATALTQFVRTIGGSIAVAIMGAMLTAQLSNRFERIEGVPAGTEANDLLNETTRSALPAEVLRAMQEALAASLHETYILVALCGALTLLIMLFFPKGRADELQARVPQPREGEREAALASTDAAGS
jgi:EmrB/QacA subfamily drug resistance transporter